MIIEIDGIQGKCKIKNVGFSDRMAFELKEKHPDFNETFLLSEYYEITKPGTLKWTNPRGPIRETSEVYVIEE